MEDWNDLLYRSADLISMLPEGQRSEAAVHAFELEVCGKAWRHDLGSDRSVKLGERMKELAAKGDVTYDSKVGEAFGHWVRRL